MKEDYITLELEEGASFEQVKEAYHRLARLYHPDKILDQDSLLSGREKFKAISLAFNRLEIDLESSKNSTFQRSTFQTRSTLF